MQSEVSQVIMQAQDHTPMVIATETTLAATIMVVIEDEEDIRIHGVLEKSADQCMIGQ